MQSFYGKYKFNSTEITSMTLRLYWHHTAQNNIPGNHQFVCLNSKMILLGSQMQKCYKLHHLTE